MTKNAFKTNLILGPTLETERLILRVPQAEDFEAFAAMIGDEKNVSLIGGAQPRGQAWRSFATMVGTWVFRGYAMFSVFEKSSGTYIGRVGPVTSEGWPVKEVGWGLIHQAWGKGYAVEAATACIDWVFDELGWEEVGHLIDEPNVNSQRVAQKLGSVNTGKKGILPPPVQNISCDIWGQTREQWRARKLKTA